MNPLATAIFDSPDQQTIPSRTFGGSYPFSPGEYVLQCEGWWAGNEHHPGYICNEVNGWPFYNKVGAACYYVPEIGMPKRGPEITYPRRRLFKIYELEPGNLKRFTIDQIGLLLIQYYQGGPGLWAQSKYTIYKLTYEHEKWKELFFQWW